MEQIQMTPEVNPESQEYIDKMAALGEAAVNNGNTHNDEAPKIPPKPDYVPDKFYNAATGEVNYEALAKSYQELEKQRSKPQETPKEAPKDEQQKPQDSQNEQDAAEKVVEQAGLNMADLSREYAEQGSLTEQSYETLAKAGIPKETVDAYIAGQQAIAEQARQQAYAVTDGQDGYQAMISWAKANLSQDEINAFNQSVNTINAGVRDIAIRGLWSRYAADTGAESKPLAGGKTTGSGNASGYQSRAELVAAMNDPKYKADPAYREQVQKKLANSTVF